MNETIPPIEVCIGGGERGHTISIASLINRSCTGLSGKTGFMMAFMVSDNWAPVSSDKSESLKRAADEDDGSCVSLLLLWEV